MKSRSGNDGSRVEHAIGRAVNYELTLADQQAYAGQAQMQRFKNYESIDVVFDKDGDGLADQPSDLDVRWKDAVRAHDDWLQTRHPMRPSGMWGLNAENEDRSSADGSE